MVLLDVNFNYRNNYLAFTCSNTKYFFFQNLVPYFGFFLKFSKKDNFLFTDTLLTLRFVPSDISNCILLKFMYAKFQVSSSKKQGSYWYLNMGHLLKITLYLWYAHLIKTSCFIELVVVENIKDKQMYIIPFLMQMLLFVLSI